MDPSKSPSSDCIVGGLEQSDNYKGPLYVGRKQIDSELVIGKVIDSWKSGYCKFDCVSSVTSNPLNNIFIPFPI